MLDIKGIEYLDRTKKKPSKYTFFNVFERFVNTLVLSVCGDGEIRTLVQTRKSITFYTFRLDYFFEIGRVQVRPFSILILSVLNVCLEKSQHPTLRNVPPNLYGKV